jgi:hypothetical protein
MKNKIFLLTLILTFSQVLVPSQYFALKKVPALMLSTACSTYQIGNVCGPLIYALWFTRPALKKASLESVRSDVPDEIVSFVSKLTEERNLLPVYVIQKEGDDFCSLSFRRTIALAPVIVQKLSDLLSKTNLTIEEQELLNLYEWCLHHELTHIHYNDSLNSFTYEKIISSTVGLITLGIMYGITKKIAPSILNSTITNNIYYKITSGLLAGKITDYVISCNIYGKYKEFRADKETPNKKELLIAAIKQFENFYQQRDLKSISHIKDMTFKNFLNFLFMRSDEARKKISVLQLCCIRYLLPSSQYNNGPLMTVLLNGKMLHPAHIHRANLFRARLEKLENVEQE